MGQGVGGGMGVNPHPVGFENRCGSALRKNPRPCLVCHATGDGKFEFERTVSRLNEMQSADYLALGHGEG